MRVLIASMVVCVMLGGCAVWDAVQPGTIVQAIEDSGISFSKDKAQGEREAQQKALEKLKEREKEAAEKQ